MVLFSQRQRKRYVFTYNGDDAIDLNTLLTSQFHLLAIINEVQREVYPGRKLSIKVEAINEGSFELQLLLEHGFFEPALIKENVDIIGGIFAIIGGLFSAYKLLKGKKADDVKPLDGNRVEININDNKGSVIIGEQAFKIYQSNKPINRAINKNFELLDKDDSIDGIEIKDKDTKEKVVEVPKEDFKSLQSHNEYLGSDTDEKIMVNQLVLIRKPDLYPKKIAIWGFIYKGRNINAVITDEEFVNNHIIGGERVGRGDGLICDLKIFYEWNETFTTYIESDRFEIVRVREIVKSGEQKSLFA
jgi:hypothetical protein